MSVSVTGLVLLGLGFVGGGGGGGGGGVDGGGIVGVCGIGSRGDEKKEGADAGVVGMPCWVRFLARVVFSFFRVCLCVCFFLFRQSRIIGALPINIMGDHVE